MENKSSNLIKVLICFLIIVGIIFIVLIISASNEQPSNPTTILIDSKNVELEIGKSINIAYSTTGQVSFTSINPEVAKVDNNGQVTGVSAGNTIIKVAALDSKAQAFVNVTVSEKISPLEVSSINVESSNSLSKKYVKKGDNLIIKINFNHNLENKPKIFINNEELSYTLITNRNYVLVEKEVVDESKLKLKIYDNNNLIYSYDLPIVDNVKPTCTLKQDGEYLKIAGTDESGISGYAISQSEKYSYSLTAVIQFKNYGTWYGYVMDNAGNEGKCSITLVKPITNIDPKNITIVGDSRMWLLCKRDWYKKEKGTCIAKSAMGYDWLVSSAISSVNDLASSKKKYIVNNLGVNDLKNSDKYVEKYKDLAQKDWKNYMIFLLSVNPTSKNYSTRNSSIDSFNQKLKNLASQYSNIHYCDSNSYLKTNGFSSYDGLHYNEVTDKVIYNQIKKCIYAYYN